MEPEHRVESHEVMSASDHTPHNDTLAEAVTHDKAVPDDRWVGGGSAGSQLWVGGWVAGGVVQWCGNAQRWHSSEARQVLPFQLSLVVNVSGMSFQPVALHPPSWTARVPGCQL